jgi:hypothetical protein
MKVRSLDELTIMLDDEFSWRQKELTTILLQLRGASEKALPMLVRAGVALLYAHWEGFFRAAAQIYLAYVVYKKIAYEDLSNSFFSLALRSQFRRLSANAEVMNHIAFTQFLRNDLNSKAVIPLQSAVETGSNLTSARLKTIICYLGLDYTKYELKENMIDEQLLFWRNNIAHGQFMFPNLSEYETLHSEITDLLRLFKDQISNAALMGLYQLGSVSV